MVLLLLLSHLCGYTAAGLPIALLSIGRAKQCCLQWEEQKVAAPLLSPSL